MVLKKITVKTEILSPSAFLSRFYDKDTGAFLFEATFKTYENGLYIADVQGKYPKLAGFLGVYAIGIARALKKPYIYGTAARPAAGRIMERHGGVYVGNFMYRKKVNGLY